MVDLAIHPASGALWVATNERDMLGNDVPQEPVTAIDQGANYGWPHCYWDNRGWAVDTRVPQRNPSCAGLTEYYGLPAHTAPLGISFYTQGAFPADVAGSAFAALHGSWNHTQGVGFKLLRIPFADGVAPARRGLRRRVDDRAPAGRLGAPGGRPGGPGRGPLPLRRPRRRRLPHHL